MLPGKKPSGKLSPRKMPPGILNPGKLPPGKLHPRKLPPEKYPLENFSSRKLLPIHPKKRKERKIPQKTPEKNDLLGKI